MRPGGTANNQSYTLRAEPPQGSGYGTTSATDVTVTGDRLLLITLVSAINVTGRIVDGENAPAQGQGVSLQVDTTGDGMYGQVAQASTDQTGSFALSVVPGTYRLVINGWMYGNSAVPGNYGLMVTPDLSLQQDTNLGDLILPVKRVDVQVQAPNGSPVANVRLSTTNAPYNPSLSLGTYNAEGSSSYSGVTTDANGQATLWLFPTANNQSYSIGVVPPTDTPFAPFTIANFVVTGPKTEIIVLQYRQTGTISGRVLDNVNNPVVGAADDPIDDIRAHDQAAFGSASRPIRMVLSSMKKYGGIRRLSGAGTFL